eukprot:TRINITY_DN9444_c0_g1_i1.p1 TRINITY_DN9444_c0_g1~~TRINITY_DN9444_c0_g1_i1.p1  ORF type:complete len:1050 (+),score=236.74 TRINITY_DN9444_c0_g1_i1:378-3152(+)
MAKAMQGKVTPRSLRQAQRNAEADRWEESRMHAGGTLDSADMGAADDDLDADMVRLIVKKPSPPFLHSGIEYSKRRELVLPVKDVSGDLYENAKKGSALLKHVRQQREREKATKDSLDSSGSMLDKIDTGKDRAAERREQVRRQRAARDNMTEEERHKEDLDDAKKTSGFASQAKSSNWSGQTVFSNQKIALQRQSLPIYEHRDSLLKVLSENNIIILVGETGSGKTTQIAQYLYEANYTNLDLESGMKTMIGCTQPRRVAAMSVAKRVAEEVGCELGDTVGYSIRFEDCTTEKTLLKYMTDGVLLREAMRDPDLAQYSAIIMDEAHERSLNTDVLFGLLKKVCARRRDLKLIVTSATMDCEKFSEFFCSCPVFRIPGRTFDVSTYYQETNVSDYVNSTVKQAIHVHARCPPGDILIFMTGQEEIEVTAMQITKELIGDFAGTLMVLPVYSLLPSEMQAKIFDPAPEGMRKCIIATNIAETSLTVDGVRYVIDTGFCKLKVFNPKTGMDTLQVFPESKAAAKQRAGRAGRTSAGICYRLFTEYQFNHEMLEMTVPEIQRTSLSSVILLLKTLGVENLLTFEFMDPPPQENMTNSMYQLWMLGALNDEGSLTSIGSDMGEIPVEPQMSKSILQSCNVETQCAEEMLIIVACLSSQSKIFTRPAAQQDAADAAREKFVVAESDHLTLLNAFEMYKRNGKSLKWCNDNFMNAKALKRVEEVRVQLREILLKKKKTVQSCNGDWDPIKRALCSGFFPNCAKRRGVQDYYSMLTGVPCCVHPSSALFNGGIMPDYVIYHELIYTSKEYMSTVTAIEGGWMEETAPRFYEVRRDRITQMMYEKKRRAEEQLEAPVKRDQPSDYDITKLTTEGAIDVVMKKKGRTRQKVFEIGSTKEDTSTPDAPVRGVVRTPSSLARPGTPGYRRRGGGF